MTRRKIFVSLTAVLVVVVGLLTSYMLVPKGSPNAPSLSRVVTAGDSKTSCIYTGIQNWIAGLKAAEAATGIKYDCIETFFGDVPKWSDWVNPGMIDSFGFAQWLAADPSHRIIILTQQLIPGSVCTSVCANPLTWEKACDSGSFNSYATTLAQNLVAKGFGSSVIRLGAEMNGPWENDFVGTTAAEETAWAQCFAQEVTAMRAVAGAHFLFVWNPSGCYENLPLGNFYPGNNYVDIIGLDQYDGFCTGAGSTTVNVANFTALEAEPDGLNAIAAFAKQEGKPLALPEWGNVDQKSPPDDTGYGDDPYYIQGIAQWITSHKVAFQSYFDANHAGIVPLSSAYPLTLAAYNAKFG